MTFENLKNLQEISNAFESIIKILMEDTALYDNRFVEITKDDDGRVVGVRRIDPRKMVFDDERKEWHEVVVDEGPIVWAVKE